MKFRCDSCGKRFASVDEPFPGRVYRIRCGRCGHLISVKAPVPWEPPADAPRPEPTAPVRAAAPAAPAGTSPKGSEETEEIPIDLALSDEFPLRRRRRVRLGRAVLLLSASGVVLAGVILWMQREPETAPASESATESASESVPTGASVRPEPVEGRASPAPAPVPARESVRPEPVEGRTAPAAAAPPAPAPRRPTPVAFERAAPAPAQVAPKPAPAGVDTGLAEAMHRKDDADVRTPERAELQRTLEARRAALDACFDYAAGTAGGAAWSGRAAQLVVTVEPNGRASGRVDDPALEPTEIASCLRRTVARTGFPAFAGEPVELRTPVGLTR